MKHPDEQTIELYVLAAAEVTDRRTEIEAHLKECAGCRSLCREIEDFYSEVQAVHEERSRAASQALTVRNMAVRINNYTEFGPLSQIPKTWPARMVLFVFRHPYAATSAFVGVIVGAVLAVQMLLTPPAQKDHDPSYARAKDEFLIVYNKGGEVLWKNHVGIGYDMDRITKDTGFEPDMYLQVADMDGDGRSEVLAIFRVDPLNKELICFNADGSDRWRYRFHRKMVFGTEEFSGDFEFQMMMVGDFNNDGKKEVVAVAVYPNYYPTAILMLDASTGTLLSEFWSSGNINQLAHRDLDGDGNEELYFGGTNNGTDRAFLIVLDPKAISGHAPAPPSHSPIGVAEGTEKYYVEFPRSELQSVATQKRNAVNVLRFETDSSLAVSVGELVGSKYYVEFYHFNRQMICTKADWQDEAMALYKKLVSEGKLTRLPDSVYYEGLRKGVQYWNGDKFVNTPTMNKKYVEKVNQLAKK